MQMVMTSDETKIQIFANWPMSHAKRVTRDNRNSPECRVVAAIRKLRIDSVLKRPNKVETAVHDCNLAFSLESIVSLPR